MTFAPALPNVFAELADRPAAGAWEVMTMNALARVLASTTHAPSVS